MTTVNQGISVEEIERVVAQRVANAIEAIAIYEMKTNMANKSISQTKLQEYKVAKNAINKRKWEGNHNGNSSQQNKRHKVLRAHTTWTINKKAYVGSLPLCNQCKFHHNGPCTNQRTRTCYECGSLRHYKSECPIVKFQKHVDMIHGGVKASKTKTMQDAIEIATKLMNKKISTLTEWQAENKKKLDNTSKNNQNQQQEEKYCATDLAIRPVTVEVLQISILLTTKKALGQVRRLHAMNVGIKGTTGEIARSERTKTMKTKSKVLKHMEWCMPLEEEKPKKTLATLRVRLKLKRESCLALPSKP
nr:hypothetical protein [Tanacetum cinerariifolium]